MKLLDKKELTELSKQKLIVYLVSYMEEQLQLSIRKNQSSTNYEARAWPYMQAEQLGTQKTLQKLIKLLT